MFTADEEISMARDPNEEASSLHREFNDRFFQTIESSHSTRYLSIEELVESNLSTPHLNSNSNSMIYGNSSNSNHSNYLSETGMNPQQQQQYNSMMGSGSNLNSNNNSNSNSCNSLNSRAVVPPNFQSTLRRMKQVYSVLEKLQIAQQYCKQLKQQVREIEVQHREYLLNFLNPVIQSVNEDPSKFEPAVLYTLLNLAREDFLNFPLHSHVVSTIKKLIVEQHESFDKEAIKNVFSAQSNRHKDTVKSFLDTNVLKNWFTFLLQHVQSGEMSERELILFLNCFQKDADLYRRNHKVIASILLKEAHTNGILKHSKNGDLLKVIVTTFTRSEQQCTQALFNLFFSLIIEQIRKEIMTTSQFQAIFRQLLRSQTFIGFKILSSYDFCAQTGATKDNEEFKVIDRFVNENFDTLQNNQILNILNMYQMINATNYLPTVERLLDRLYKQFTPQCDNYFSFNITVRVLSLFSIPNPKKYLSFYRSWQKRENEVHGMQRQVANTLAILKHCLPQCFTPQMEKIHLNLLEIVQNEEESSNNYINNNNNNYSNGGSNVRNNQIQIHSDILNANGGSGLSSSSIKNSQMTGGNPSALKRLHQQEVQRILERMDVEFQSVLFIDSVQVDLYVFAGEKKQIKEKKRKTSKRIQATESGEENNHESIAFSGNSESNISSFANNNNNNQSNTEQLPPFSFAIDFISSNDFMIPKVQLNGSLSLKYSVLQRMHIPTVVLSEEFCIDILSIQSHALQQKLLVSHINKQILLLSEQQNAIKD